jgi:predicted nucleic acid-binding protein
MKKSRSIFIDADAVVALSVSSHSLHPKATKIMQGLQSGNLPRLYISTYVVLEATTVISKYSRASYAVERARKIFLNPQILVISGDKFLDGGLKTMLTQKSKNVSLADCVYFSICKHLGINDIFSFDKHWVKNGFNLIT